MARLSRERETNDRDFSAEHSYVQAMLAFFDTYDMKIYTSLPDIMLLEANFVDYYAQFKSVIEGQVYRLRLRAAQDARSGRGPFLRIPPEISSEIRARLEEIKAYVAQVELPES